MRCFLSVLCLNLAISASSQEIANVDVMVTIMLAHKAETKIKQVVKLTVKPGSVVDSHSSRLALTRWLKQPTQVQYGPYLMKTSIWPCSRWSLPCRALLPDARCALTAPFHPYLIPDVLGPLAVCFLLHLS
ncbi:MAG: hypothetical protein HNEKOMLI_00869 [Sodalis sp. Psp]|nr:hypothetical protein [Sodalis sp. Psp]MCR3757328.1 hypothetical protein [Sodalis sp. Ppy]